MKHIACAVALVAASLLNVALAASTYSASTYTAPPVEPNPWSWTSAPLDPVGTYGGNWHYTLSNALTGETRGFDLRTSALVQSVSVNRQGEALLVAGGYSEPGQTYLYRNGSIAPFSYGAVGGVAWNNDGSINQNTYSNGGGYRDMRYEYGQWFTVSGYGAPGSSAVKDVNASGMAVGDVRFMGMGSWSTAVKAQNNGEATTLNTLASPFGAASWTYAINDAGWILGQQTDYAKAGYEPSCCGFPWGEHTLGTSRALIWDPSGQVFDLNGWLDTTSAAQLHLDAATSFLADGSILASGYALSDPGKLITIRLSAVPEVQTWLMMVLGLVGLAVVAGRRRALPFMLAA